MSEDWGPMALALAKAQAAFPSIPRDRTVKVQAKSGASYTFAYAPLDTILAAVRGPLAANGLAVSQLLDGGDLVTLLLHESGHKLEGRQPLPLHPSATIQEMGSAVTYLRRYALQAILGIASEEDDDGNHASGNAATPAPRQAQAPRPSAPITTNSVGPSPENISALHARFAEPEGPVPGGWSQEELGDLDGGIAPAGGLTSRELFTRAEERDIPKATLTLAAKRLFGDSHWKVTELDDEQRAALWEEVAR